MKSKQKGNRRTSFRSMLEGLLEEDRAFRWDFEEEKIKLGLAEALELAREERGLTQQELADYCYTTQSAISRLLAGQDARSPRLDTLIKLADAVGMEVRVTLRPRAEAAAWRAPVIPIGGASWDPLSVKEGPGAGDAHPSWSQQSQAAPVLLLSA